MKKITQLLLLTVLTIILAACGGDESDQASSTEASGKDEEVIVNIANLGYSVLNVAAQNGSLEKALAEHNATYEYTIHQSGPPINEGIASKRVDFAVLGEGAIVSGLANGLDTKLVSLAAGGKTGLNNILATKKSGITKAEDLKGKKIAVGFGTSHHVFLLKVLKDIGLSADDVTLVNLQIPDAHPAFQTNQVDAWVTVDLYANIEAANGAVVVANGKQYDLYSPIFYIARGEFAEKHPEIVEAILTVINETIALSESDQDAYYDAAAKAVNQDVQLVRASENFDLLNEAPSEEIVEQFQETIEILKQLEFITKDVEIKQFIDTSYIDNVNK